MQKTRLGKTELMVTRTSFGALPLQRCDMDTAVTILRAAYDSGINFYDTARAYSDSEEKLGNAFPDVRDNIIIATKTFATTKDGVLEHIKLSLQKLKTDYVDILQLHNPGKLPDINDENSSYAGLLEAKKLGLCRFIGVTQHSKELAKIAVLSDAYDTLQFPFSCLATEDEIELTELCKEHDMGFIAMKAMCGGLITETAANFAFIRQYENVVPIYGIQKMEELEEFIQLDALSPDYDETAKQAVLSQNAALQGSFCRGCGYCMPCPMGINISMCARMSLLLRRGVWQEYTSESWRAEMAKVHTCTNCGSCKAQCPYLLDTPELLKFNINDYEEFIKQIK